MPSYNAQLTLGSRIGGGQFGDVFEGLCPVHGRVAVKVLKQNAGESLAEWARRSATLIQEAQKLKTATHPNVVQIFQIVSDSASDLVHLVAEFCDGGSVDTLYKAGPLPLLQSRKIVTDACRGLERIHACGMIHRDIKPANILRHRNGYKIGDFGLVSDRLLLGYASADGYVSHLAPEVFGRPTGTIGVTSAKSDVWSLGMTLYRLLHGHDFYRDVFGLTTPAEFRQMIVDGGFCRALRWLPHIPEPWRKFIRKTLHDDSAQRFQTAHAMSQAIARLSVSPGWSCQYRFDNVKWTRSENGRAINVEWQIHSPRKHEWHAKRVGGGKRDMLVGGAPKKIISRATAMAEIETFFSTSL